MLLLLFLFIFFCSIEDCDVDMEDMNKFTVSSDDRHTYQEAPVPSVSSKYNCVKFDVFIVSIPYFPFFNFPTLAPSLVFLLPDLANLLFNDKQ